MELAEFIRQTHGEVNAQIGERLSTPGSPYPYKESVFAEVVMEHMAEIGMTFEPMPCHFSGKVGNANLRLSGYAVSEESDQLDLFVSLYEGVEEPTAVSDTETKTAAEQCLRFFSRCAEGRLAKTIDPSHEAYALALTIEDLYKGLEQIRIYVLTDRVAKQKNFKSRESHGKTVKLEVMDIERLFRHWSEGKPRDELVVSFSEISGTPLPCVYVPNDLEGYDYALTVIPGDALRFLYDKYGPRLLEANVRSFLSATGKVNRGIRDTLKNDPERFMAYNNGIVLIADDIRLAEADGGGTGIAWLKGMQIVNGGQTTASIYFTKKREPTVDLGRVRVPAKIIILRPDGGTDEEAIISDISRYANSQNAVRVSDLSANKPFHVELEKLATTTYCPDGIGRWFYERAAGSYQTMLAREKTPARQKKLKDSMPTSRKITKTDLAKYLNAWNQKPDVVSRGAQKNFQAFMDELPDSADSGLPDVTEYKRIVARAILYKAVQRLARSQFAAFQANITSYTVSLIANRLGGRIDLDMIWRNQAVSGRLLEQSGVWAREVNAVLQETADGRMISEWAKKPECWNAVVSARYSSPFTDIPEVA